jgi:hypothetical protein
MPGDCGGNAIGGGAKSPCIGGARCPAGWCPAGWCPAKADVAGGGADIMAGAGAPKPTGVGCRGGGRCCAICCTTLRCERFAACAQKTREQQEPRRGGHACVGHDKGFGGWQQAREGRRCSRARGHTAFEHSCLRAHLVGELWVTNEDLSLARPDRTRTLRGELGTLGIMLGLGGVRGPCAAATELEQLVRCADRGRVARHVSWGSACKKSVQLMSSKKNAAEGFQRSRKERNEMRRSDHFQSEVRRNLGTFRDLPRSRSPSDRPTQLRWRSLCPAGGGTWGDPGGAGSRHVRSGFITVTSGPSKETSAPRSAHGDHIAERGSKGK